jgi:glyoxylase-like metal-dependent hydrolase (beta-lactamase superfamily II)
MKRAVVLALFAVSIGAYAPAQAQSAGQDIVKRAVAAAGGEQALRALKAVKITGEAKWWEPDQAAASGGAALFVGDTKFTIVRDLVTDSARTSLDRTIPSIGQVQFQEIVTPNYGFVTDEKHSRAMSGIRVAAQLRELRRVAPNLLIKMLDNPGNTSFEGGVRTGDGVQPGVNFKDGATTFTVIFNKKTQLPAIVRTQDDDAVRGTANYEVRFDDWKPVAGALVPHQLTYTLGETAIGRVRYTQVEANPAVDPAQFAAPDEIKASLKPPATGNVPYQWVIRRLALGFFLDSDKVFVPEGGSLKLVELAPNIQHVVGGSHNNLIVNMKDGVVVFDAPINDQQSRWVMNAAREKYGKPVKQLVLTHHHNDHIGGVRSYMAEGAALLVPVPDKKYFVKVALAEHIVADDLQNKKQSVDITEIKEEMTLKDSETEIRLIRIPNHHADAMLIAHIMPANIVYVTDLYSPGHDTRKTNGLLSFNDSLRRLGIKNATIAGGHGGSGPQSAVEAIADVK